MDLRSVERRWSRRALEVCPFLYAVILSLRLRENGGDEELFGGLLLLTVRGNEILCVVVLVCEITFDFVFISSDVPNLLVVRTSGGGSGIHSLYARISLARYVDEPFVNALICSRRSFFRITNNPS